MGRLQRYRPQCLCAAGIESRRRTINRGARRRIIGAAAIGIALAFSGLSISRQGPNGQTAWRVSLVSPAHAEEEYVEAIIRVIEGAMNSGATNSGQSSQAGSSGHLGMYVPSDFSGQPGSGDALSVWGGNFDVTSGGVVERDSIAGVTKSPSIHDRFSYGGIYGVYDASRFLPENQTLTFWGTVDVARDNLIFGPGPLPGESVSAGSDQFNLYILAGSAKWTVGSVYLQGLGMAVFGNGTQLNTFDGGTGNFTTNAYAIDAKLGNVFVLYSTSGATPLATLPTKAASRTTNGDNGYMLGLDLSGHVGYIGGTLIGGFTDSVGFTTGNMEAKIPMLGPAAKFFAVIPSDKFQLTPYVTGAVDYLPGYSITRTFPSQPLLFTGDVQTFLPAQTYYSGEIGLDLKNDAGWTIKINAMYMASSDTIIRFVGGYVKIPLDFAPVLATRY